MSHARRLWSSPWASPALMGLALAAIAAVGPVGDGVGLCPYRNIFGVACPGCGMSRATAHLLNGDVQAALTYHPLVPLVVAQAVVGAVAWFGHKKGWWRVSQRTVVVLGVVNVVMLVGVWAARAVSGTLPPA